MAKGRARQDIFTQTLIARVRELFGDTSPEYGMALCGATQLVNHLGYYRENFSPDDLLTAHAGGETADQLVKHAKWIMDITDLQEDIRNHLGPNTKRTSWFK